MPLLVGTSGRQYRHWRDTFYPRGVAQAKWLEYYAARFAALFNNDHRGCALRDARVFALAGRNAGWTATRIPEADEVRPA